MEENKKPVLVVSKIRIYDPDSIKGLEDYCKVYGVSHTIAIRMILGRFFSLNEEGYEVYIKKPINNKQLDNK